MSNYPLSYKLSWLPRFLKPSLGGDGNGFAPMAGTLMEPPPGKTVRLAFIGDISAVANRQAPDCDPAIKALLGTADLVIGNCESPVVDRPSAMLGTKLGTHHAMTERFLTEALAATGIACAKLVLSLANNHALDQGVAGFDETVAALERLGIRIIGLAADGPVQPVKVGPVNVGFAAFTLWRNADESLFAERVSMGSDLAGWPRNGFDLLCAVPHWDWEFRHFPRAGTRALARRLAGQGVGLIAGHHAHVVQPVERIGETVVAYGLGDFLGTALARQPWPGRIGGIFVADVSADAGSRGAIAAYRMHPFVRLRDGGSERLVPAEGLEGAMRGKVEERLGAIFLLPLWEKVAAKRPDEGCSRECKRLTPLEHPSSVSPLRGDPPSPARGEGRSAIRLASLLQPAIMGIVRQRGVAVEAADFMPDETVIAGIRKNIEAYEAARASAVWQVRWRVPLFVGLVLVAVALIAWLFNKVADPNEQWFSTPHVFLYIIGFIVSILVYFRARKPATRLQQSFRETLMPIIFGFIGDMRYQHDVTPNSFDRLPRETVGGASMSRFDDIISGRYDGFAFELYEADLWDGASTKTKATTFKGVIVAFEAVEPFPGILVATRRTNAVMGFFRSMFASKMQELSSGVPELDAAYEFRTDNVEAARPLVMGRLAQALKWLGETWPDDPARVALNGGDGFLLLPQAKNFFELPEISVPLDYTRHVAPMISDMGAMLATAALVRKIGAKDEG